MTLQHFYGLLLS